MAQILVETQAWQAAPRALPAGQVVFAIGDVHAHADHLRALQARIAAIVAADHAAQQVSVVWLGDYIDRGWQPLEALDLVAAGLGRAGIEEIRLLGNHEVFLIEAATGADLSLARLLTWWQFGGAETLKTLAPDARIEQPAELMSALREGLGQQRLAFLDSLALQHRIGDYVFVHAGLNPDRPLADQRREDLLWIREPFLTGQDWPHPVTVVHGHTPDLPTVLSHRIGIDSGVFASGSLTAVELQGTSLRFIATREENDDRSDS